MARDRILAVALLCGIAAFLWTLLARSAAPTPPARPSTATRPREPIRDRAGAEQFARDRANDFQAWFIVATLRQAAHDPDAAREAWQETARSAATYTGFPDEPRATFFLARAREHLGDAQGARAAYERAAAAHEAAVAPEGRFSGRYQAWIRLAWCRQKLGDDAAARRAWEQATQLIDLVHPTEASAAMMYDRACCTAQRGDPDVAMWCLNKAAQKGFKDYEWAAADESLAPLRADPRFIGWLAKRPGG